MLPVDELRRLIAVDSTAAGLGGRPHPLSREVAIVDGNHILLSPYVRTDKKKIREETQRFLRAALVAP